MKISNAVIREEIKEKTVAELEDSNIFLLDFDEKNVRILDIDPVVSYKYSGDFYALLLELGINKDKWLVTLQINDMTSPAQWKGDRNYITHL